MKVAILTWATNTNNYGSILQAYALQKFLENNQYENELLDYYPKVSDYQWPSSFSLYRKKVLRKIKRKIAKRSTTENSWKERLNSSCRSFVDEKLNVSKKYVGLDEIKKANSKYDAFICGSDQIWSMQRVINPVYYLTWVKKGKGKIAYAPSIPSGKFNDKKKKALIDNTKDFTDISIREERAAKEIGRILNRNIISTLDPTLLVEDDFWIEKTKSHNNDKFILCYFLGNNQRYKECVQEAKDKTGYEVKVVPFNEESFNINGEIQYDVGPKEFIDLVRNAELVLTDSYHGTIFSIIFEKKFVLFKRFIDGEKKDENDRIYDLTKKLKLERQICDASGFNFEDIKNPDYHIVKNCLKKERDKSISFLLNSLKRCEINE